MFFFGFVGLLSGLLWGLNDVLTNVLANHFILSSIQLMLLFAAFLAFLQDALSAFSIIGFYTLCSNWRLQWREMAPARRIIFTSAVCAGPLGLLCSILAINEIGAVYAGAITAAYPLVTLVGSSLYLRESLSKWRVLGVIMGVVAVVAIGFQGEAMTAEPSHFLGFVFAFISLFGWGMESVFFSAAHKRTNVNSSAILALRQLFSSACYLLILLFVFMSSRHGFHLIDAVMSHPGLVVWCIVSACLSYLTYYFCIKVLSASTATLFNVSFIFWSAILSVVIGLVILSWWFWLWACLLFMGIVIAMKN